MRALPRGLYALCDDTFQPPGAPPMTLVEKAQLLLEGGAPTLQLRFKVTPVRQALAAAREIVRLCHGQGALCLINDRVDWVLLSDADGVHLGADDLPIAEARRLLGSERLIGGTVRTLEGCHEAQGEGADYVGVGPIFGTRTKRVDFPPLGLSAFETIARGSPLPVVGIAGITLETIGAVAASGAHAAAVVSAALEAADIPERVRALKHAFESRSQARSVPRL